MEKSIMNFKTIKRDKLPMASGYEDNLMNASQEKHLVAFERCN